MSILEKYIGDIDQKSVSRFTLINSRNIQVKILNYGGIVSSIITPDKEGAPGDIVLGFDDLKDYLNGHPYFGAICGRYANRIARGRFNLDGKQYTLAINNGPNALHGGIKGFDKVVWDAAVHEDSNTLELRYLSKHLEEGYPGNVSVRVLYSLTEENELIIRYAAETDQLTHINLTNHSYFNLSCGTDNILGHQAQIFAPQYTPVDEHAIPTGEVLPVANTPFDFTKPFKIGERIDKIFPGYDHHYVIDPLNQGLKPFARIIHQSSGRMLEMFSTEPGVQFYTGNFLDGSLTGKNGIIYDKHFGVCLEAQHFPDTPNQKDFPSTILAPGEPYSQTTVYKFGLSPNVEGI